MKTFYTIFLCCITYTLFSQNLNFIQPDARWQVTLTDINTPNDPDYIYEYHFGADTLINDTTYTLVMRAYYYREPGIGGVEQFPQPFQVQQASIYAAVREDLTEEQLFVRIWDINEQTFTEEQLLYDFSLVVGDQLEDVLGNPGEFATITSVTTQNIYGAERRVWNTFEGVVFIEGVGSVQGPFEGLGYLISGGYTNLLNYCNGVPIDCNVMELNDMVHSRRQYNVLYATSGLGGPQSFWTYEYRFGDTLNIDGDIYVQVLQRQQELSPDFTPMGALRQDGNKIYRLDEYNNIGQGSVLYDFDMSVGDSLVYPALFLNEEIIVTVDSIDQVVLADGEVKKRFYVSYPTPAGSVIVFDIWIEDIGLITNLFTLPEIQLGGTDLPTYSLQCYYKDYEQEPVYPTMIDSCYTFVVSTDDVLAPNPITVFPNPFGDQLQLSEMVSNGVITLFNAHGQRVAVRSTDNSTIDVSQMPKGIYWYQIRDERQQLVGRGKVVKQ